MLSTGNVLAVDLEEPDFIITLLYHAMIIFEISFTVKYKSFLVRKRSVILMEIIGTVILIALCWQEHELKT